MRKSQLLDDVERENLSTANHVRSATDDTPKRT
jgi:hypothetical protein